jgi:cysteine-rich repeat protein
MQSSKACGLLLAVGLAFSAPACGKDEGTGHTSNEETGGEGGEGPSGSGDGGEGEPGGAGSSGYEGDCEPVKLGRPGLYFNVLGELNGLKYPVLTSIGDKALREYLLVELFDSTTQTDNGFLPALSRGNFDLSRAPNNHVTSCQHCVSLVSDVTEGVDALGFPVFQPAKWYFQRSGQLHLEEVHDPLNESAESSALKGGVEQVELAQIDLDDPLQPFVENGKCFYLPKAEFDTRPTPGKQCEDLDDCGNEVLEICDPATLRCLDESQCNIDVPCQEPGFCMQQSPLSQLGACYPSCDPFAEGACPDGRTCVQYGISEHDGYCLTAGQADLGDACQAKDAVTDCGGTAVCVDSACVGQCGFFSGAPECSAGSCDVLGHCLDPDAGDPAALGEKCAASAALAGGCARNGGRFDGICFAYLESEPLECQKSCFVDEDDYDGNADDGADDPDCAEDQFCALRFSSGLGVCLPDPVCGDGDFGEVGEVCDDHNKVSGDGCSADCQTVEYDVLCASPPALPATGKLDGTTAGGLDGFKSSCQLGTSRGRIYSTTPPGPGQLEFLVTSDTNHVVGVRSACDGAESELGCGQFDAGQQDGAPLLIQVTDASPQPVTVLVNATTVVDEGPFSLTTKFTPQVCGDSLKVGAEACDDGNQESNDGCSADCSAIEYDYWCDNAATLPLNKSVAGDVEGAPHLYSPSCGYGEGPDKLYQVKATKAGTLTITLNQNVGGTETDLSLLVLGACGAPAPENELGCSAVVSPAEEVSVDVTAGQTVFVVVDGLFSSAGKYELRATLQ